MRSRDWSTDYDACEDLRVLFVPSRGVDVFPDNRSTRDYDPTTDRFTADGGLEPTEESVATSLEDFDADVSHREVETRLNRPVASEFSIDDRVDELEATLGEKDDRINELEATNEALREQLSDSQEVLERRDQYSNPEIDEAGADDGDSIWGRARRFVGNDN